MGQTEPNSQFFADFCRLSLFLGITALQRRRFSQKTFRKPQIFAGNRRKPQIFRRNLFPEGPTIKKIRSRSKFSISIKIFDLARKFQSRLLDFPTKNRAAVGGSLENFILARNFQFRSKPRIFLIFGQKPVCPISFLIPLRSVLLRPRSSFSTERSHGEALKKWRLLFYTFQVMS